MQYTINSNKNINWYLLKYETRAVVWVVHNPVLLISAKLYENQIRMIIPITATSLVGAPRPPVLISPLELM